MVKVYLQEACLRHQFIRSKDTSTVVERPERLRAVNVGIAAVLARTSELATTARGTSSSTASNKDEHSEDDLASAISKLNIAEPSGHASTQSIVEVVKSSAKVNILNHAAVKYIHGDIGGDVYLEKLIKLSQESRDKIASGDIELPEGWPPGDLYLCPESMDAVQGALGTVCEAVDEIIGDLSSTSRAFVAVRPPGHHCGEDMPSGFCFVNNVAVAAAHAHLKHDITRVVIFDIDLHHGNGTQSIVWQINEETYRVKLEEAYGAPAGKPGLQVFYGSLHDILSYPCEDGKPELVQAASVSIHGPHGQFIENIHLDPYTNEEDFYRDVYEKKYSRLLEKAHDFITATGGTAKNDILVFISCGFDACEHEYESMSRHQRKVPVSFYHRFAQDARRFADSMAGGRLISVLEGGYSDRALTSGVIAHLSGLGETETVKAEPDWWKLDNLVALEKATKKRRGGRQSVTKIEPWLEHALEYLAQIDTTPPSVAAPLSMALRERTKPVSTSSETSTALPAPKAIRKRPKQKVAVKQEQDKVSVAESIHPQGTTEELQTSEPVKKLPRVILKLGPGPAKEEPYSH
ncbi:hypothetical protein PHLGIDRAFT_72030 [Phlebiopsis gigantea 11061_1 CR5-6]|uniref:Histone deacetylase domain-containing protein n=1 Tax=Phlebiopsis gigantea (strain 11061_1 CR5-6) TaxID=745531 RepID=A0A0C3S7L7_PHLG1|nr:hypothetical protein PHLGIDRAFT_72030 [Phlebiopsis gigantea 11061_1 CR5-6]